MNGLMLVKVYSGLTYLGGELSRPAHSLGDWQTSLTNAQRLLHECYYTHPLNVIHSLWVEIPLNGFSHLLNLCSD